jgi:hypothetical protein
MVTSALESFGELVNNWLNACSLLVHESLGMSENKAERCEESVRMNSIVLDAARAIEGFESVAALERLEGRGGLPDMQNKVCSKKPKAVIVSFFDVCYVLADRNSRRLSDLPH